MPLVLADRVNETTTTTSTGTITLAGAVSGYQSFAVIGNGNTTYYTIVHQTANEWEVGIGTYTSSGTTLSRDTVLASSNSGSLVNFSAGTKFVFCDYPAGRAVYLDTATNVTIPGLTLSGGTANGVAFLNASKVVTAGTALTFNGTTLVSPDITDSSLTSGRVTYAGAGGNFVDSANLTFNGTTLVAADLTDSSLTSGRVVFSGAGGNLSDSSSLTWNGTGLGVGTSSAGVLLDVRSSIGSTPGFNNNVARFLSTATAAVGVGGAIVFGGKTGNLTADWAFAGLQGVKESATASNYAGSLLFLTQNSVGSTSLSEHMRLLSTGDFGIGTAAPNYKLDVRGTIATGNGTVRMALSSTAADGITGTLSNHGLFFYTNNVARGYFDTSGSLGLGTTTSRGDLDVSSGATGTSITKSIHLGYSSANFYGFRLANTNAAGSFFAGTFSIQRGTGSAWSDDFAVNNSGNVGIGTTNPTNTAGFSRQLQIEGTTAALTLSGTTGTGKYTLGVPGVNACGLWDNTASAYRWYVDSSGNLLVGTTSAGNARFVVRGPGTTSATASLEGATSGGATRFLVSDDGLCRWYGTSNAETMRLDNAGNLGINTTSPTAKLHVVNSTPNSGRQTLFLDSNYGNAGDSAASIRTTLNSNAGGTYIWGLTSESVLAHNMEFISGSNWVARSTTASYLSQTGGIFAFYSNQSLTAGSTFTPTERMRLTSGGDLQLGGTQGTTPALGRGMYVENTTGIVGYSLYVNNGVNNRRGSMFLDNTSGVWGWDVTASSGIPYYVWRVAGSEKMRLTDDGRLALADGNAPTQVLSLYRGGSTNAIMSAGNSNTGLDGTWFGVDTAGNGIVNVRGAFPLIFSTSALERARITAAGEFYVGQTAGSINVVGAYITGGGQGGFCVSSSPCILVNRKTSDGTLVSFRQDDVEEGSISVSGTTVSYNGGHLSRWSQTADNTRIPLLKGTVMSNLDQMAVWEKDGQPLPNEQLNCMKVSDVEGDVNVAGVFVNWDNDDDESANDMNVAMTGDMIIRIAQGVVVQRGDLLMSAGDGTAKPQGDDIIRSKTVAKVTSTHVTCTYEDGSYCIPCVLMAC